MKRLGWLALAASLAACGTEGPLNLGEELLPEDAVRTFEVVLEPAQFLLTDTAFSLYGDVEEAPFVILARGYGGALEANVLARFQIPTALSVTDTLGIARTDSLVVYVRGEVIMRTDSAASTAPANARVALHSITEPWDPVPASWTLRQANTPWTVPGGTVGALVDTARFARGDSLVLHVDSATLRMWADTANLARGARISVLDAPARIRASRPRLKLYARSRFKPDTLFTTEVTPLNGKFIFTPPVDSTAGDLRFNGTPVWRSLLRIRPDLRNVTIACGTGCTTNLRDAHITRAELLLQPRSSQPGFDPELDIAPVAYLGLVAPEIPLERTPVGGSLGTLTKPMTREQYRDDAAPVGLVITEFVRQAVTDTTTNTAKRLDWLVLSPGATPTFGYGRFAAQPRLRLVLTTAREIQLP